MGQKRSTEARSKRRVSKRKRWLSRGWRLSAKGYPSLRANGYRVTVYPRGSGGVVLVSSDDNSFVHHGRRNYPTQEQAKLAAFDHITRLAVTQYLRIDQSRSRGRALAELLLANNWTKSRNLSIFNKISRTTPGGTVQPTPRKLDRMTADGKPRTVLFAERSPLTAEFLPQKAGCNSVLLSGCQIFRYEP